MIKNQLDNTDVILRIYSTVVYTILPLSFIFRKTYLKGL